MKKQMHLSMSAWTFKPRHSVRPPVGLPIGRAVWIALVLACVCNSSWAQLSAGRVMAASGTIKATDPQGKVRLLEKGGEVYSGDKVVTADGALAQVRLNDGGYLSIRPGTEMVFDRFVYDEKDASKSNFLVSLVRGGFRSITGLIGRTNPNAYQIRTSTATVGIRGTDHEPMVIQNIPGMAAMGAPGLYDKVNDGETFIRNKDGMLSLKRGDVGFAPLTAGQAPQTLPKIPAFYKVEVKVDARDPNDGASTKPETSSPAPTVDPLRPSTAARREALREAQNISPAPANAPNAGLQPPLAPTTGITGGTLPLGTRLAPATLQTSVIEPKSTSTVPLLAPTTLVTPTRIAPTTTLIAPTTTQIAPTSTLIAPSTTLIAPTTTQIAPTSTLIAPTSTLIAPTTTLTAPKTTINSTILLK